MPPLWHTAKEEILLMFSLYADAKAIVMRETKKRNKSRTSWRLPSFLELPYSNDIIVLVVKEAPICFPFQVEEMPVNTDESFSLDMEVFQLWTFRPLVVSVFLHPAKLTDEFVLVFERHVAIIMRCLERRMHACRTADADDRAWLAVVFGRR